MPCRHDLVDWLALAIWDGNRGCGVGYVVGLHQDLHITCQIVKKVKQPTNRPTQKIRNASIKCSTQERSSGELFFSTILFPELTTAAVVQGLSKNQKMNRTAGSAPNLRGPTWARTRLACQWSLGLAHFQGLTINVGIQQLFDSSVSCFIIHLIWQDP